MAPTPLTPEQEELVSYFTSCGLTPTRSTEVVRSKYTQSAHHLFQQTQLHVKPLEDKLGALVLQIAKDGNKLEGDDQKVFIVEKIRKGDLGKSDQVSGMSTLFYTLALSCETVS